MKRRLTDVERLQPKLGNPINSKLGPGIHTWSIPAQQTCPGATKACLGCCYALSGFFNMPSVKDRLQRNYLFTKSPDFVSWMMGAVWAQGVSVLRIHVAGDMYDAAYIRKWVEIVQSTTRVRYFAYTRSWRIPELVGPLRELASCRNIQLWLSADVDTGKPPQWPEARGIAWMTRTPAEEQATPAWADLVFRDNDATLLKRANGIQVCPNEIGLPAEYPKLTCTQCRICWRPKLTLPVEAPPVKIPAGARRRAKLSVK